MSIENNNKNIEQEKQNKNWWKNCWVKTQPTSYPIVKSEIYYKE